MYSDHKNFNAARKINWRVNDLSDAFSEAARNCHGVRFLFASDNGDVIDYAMLDFDETFKNERIYSLLKHEFIPLGFVMRSQNLRGVIYLPNYDRVRLGEWALELLEQFRGNFRGEGRGDGRELGEVAISQAALEERIEMIVERQDADWLSFANHLFNLRDSRGLR